MKIYAKQVPPEYQESPLFWDDYRTEGIELFGNRDYKRNTSDLFDSLDDIITELRDAWDDFSSGRRPAWYDSWAAALNDLARPTGRAAYTREERKKTWPALLDAWDGYDKSVMCEILELITGRVWDWCTLRGCCQGDWQYCIYPVDDWDGAALERLEAEYFNTGTEWIVHNGNAAPDGPEDIDGFSVYCTAWNDDGIRREIADAAGGSPEEVTLYKFDEFTKIAKYTEV
jgi:hypothetical protein